MNYFIVKESLNSDIIGNDYPQAYKFIKGYNPDDSDAIFSLYKYRTAFPDFVPNLDGLMFSGCAKITDFVSTGFSHRHYIISERTKLILEQYNLCPHQFYPLGLYKRNKKYNYCLLNTISDYSDFVDYKKSSFVEYDISTGKKEKKITINSKEELLKNNDILEGEKGVLWTTWAINIVMNKYFDNKIDFFRIGIIDADLYISERLKDDIESNGLTGWEFISASNLMV